MRTSENTDGAVSEGHVERVNRAIGHIVRNLDRSLKLEEVSEAAGFFPFHFHRSSRPS